MVAKEYVQILNEREQLRQKILELSTNAPEAYKGVFEKIARDKDGLADPADPTEIARVWFSGIAFAFRPHSTIYLEDIKQLIRKTPKDVSVGFGVPQVDAMVENLNVAISVLKNSMDRYLTLDEEKNEMRNELQARRSEHLSQKIWEKEIEDRDKGKRVREYQQVFECSCEKLFEIVESLFSKYSQQTGMGGTIEGDKNFYFINQPLIPYWVFLYETDSRLGHYIFQVEKLYAFDGDDLFLDPDTYDAIPELADGAGFYREIGHITVSQTLDVNLSMISTRTENADLLDFFKALLEKIEIPKKANLADKAQTIKPLPEPKRSLKVFLCYAHSDKDIVKALYDRLKKDGVDVWLDKEKLLPGQDWELEIRKAVREADVVVVCLSRQFNQAGFRQKEVKLALDTAMEKPEGEIFIIPARLEECANLESLRRWHWVDLFEEDGYSKLTRSLNLRAEQVGAVFQGVPVSKTVVKLLAGRDFIDPEGFIVSPAYQNNSGVGFFNDGKYAEAINLFQSALLINEHFGDRTSEATILNNLGSAHEKVGDLVRAVEFYERAIQISKEISNDLSGFCPVHGSYVGLACPYPPPHFKN